MKRIAKEIWEWTVGLLAIMGLVFLLTPNPPKEW